MARLYKIRPLARQWDRVRFRGFTFNRRTMQMIVWAERRAGFRFPIAQGGWNAGGVSASAGTHDGSALDVGCAGLSQRQVTRALNSLKLAGFAAWERKTIPGLWGHHIHAIPIGDPHVSAGAAQQIASYLRHRDGLAADGYDPTSRPRRRFVWRLRRPVRR